MAESSKRRFSGPGSSLVSPLPANSGADRTRWAPGFGIQAPGAFLGGLNVSGFQESRVWVWVKCSWMIQVRCWVGGDEARLRVIFLFTKPGIG